MDRFLSFGASSSGAFTPVGGIVTKAGLELEARRAGFDVVHHEAGEEGVAVLRPG